MCYDILFDRMIPHALYVDSQPLVYVKDVYINVDMIIIMNNADLLNLLMIYNT